jgi:hypothetical protein
VAERRDEVGIRHVGLLFWIYIVLIVAGLVAFSVLGIAHR